MIASWIGGLTELDIFDLKNAWIDNLTDDKTSNPLVFLYTHLYDSLHRLPERGFLLMEIVISYDQN